MNLDWGILDVDWCRQRGARVGGTKFRQGLEGRLSLEVVVRILDLALMMCWYIGTSNQLIGSQSLTFGILPMFSRD